MIIKIAHHLPLIAFALQQMQHQTRFVLYHPRVIRTSIDHSCLGSITISCEATAPCHGMRTVAGSGGSGEGSGIVATAAVRAYEKRLGRDMGRARWAVGPAQGPSEHDGRAPSAPHEVAGTGELAAHSCALGGVEGARPNPASGRDGNGGADIARGPVETGGGAQHRARVDAQQGFCAKVRGAVR